MALAPRVAHLPQACDEHELIGAVRAGDGRAFEELFSRYRPRITAYALRYVSDHGRAEDLTQEVFISALRRLRGTERPIAFRPWIYEIARNACIDEFRRTRRTREVPLGREQEPAGDEPELESPAPTPDHAAETRQRLADLRSAFGGLSDLHHRILVLRELEGLSYEQIADQMGLSRTVVESTLFRARRRLNEEYQELVSGRRCELVLALLESHPSTGGSLGLRRRRLVTTHLEHCPACRRSARVAGFVEVA